MRQLSGRAKQLIKSNSEYLLVLAIALIALWPFLSRASLPAETDAELHIFRLHELTLLTRGGEVYPRWAPNFYHGYGYPIFNYYAPLSYYVGLPISLLNTFDAVTAVKTTFILALLLAAFGTYGFVRDNWGREAGFIATAVYLYAPYIQYIDPHARGVLAESFSFGMFPIALWALDRLGKRNGGWQMVAATVCVAGVILSHNLMGLLFFGILLSWEAWRLIFVRDERCWLPLTAVFLGLCAASFFWLPVFLERDAVNLNTLIGQGDNFDFRTHFLSVRELLAPSLRLDWGATEPRFRFNLGVAQWVLGLVGLVGLWRGWGKNSRKTSFSLLSFLFLLFLMLPSATFLWETVPFLPFFQFPWRLMGAAAFMLAVIAGVGIAQLLQDSSHSEWLLSAAVLLPILFGLPLTQPAPWPEFGEVNSLRMSLIEHQGRWLGTTSTADFVPATVDIIPERNGNVVAGFYDGAPLDRVNRATLPDGAVVNGEEIRPLHFRYTISTPKKMQLRLFILQFPGWQATLNGEPIETELGRPEGFIIVPIPEGEHVVDVRFGSTAVRQVGFWVSWVAVVAAVVLSILYRGKAVDIGGETAVSPKLWGSVVGLVLLFVLLLNPTGVLRFNSSNFVAQPAQTDLQVNFGDQIMLIGMDGDNKQRASAGDTLPLTFYWQAQTDLDINYQLFVHVLRPDGSLLTQSDKLNPGDFPTRRWPTDKYVRDSHLLQFPPDTPAGIYTVSVGLWVQTEGWRLPIFDVNDNQVGDSAELFLIVVE